MNKYAFLDATKEDRDLISDIIKKYDSQREGIKIDRLSAEMDLLLAHYIFKLRLEDLLNADKFNFNHDLVGIQNSINREKLCFDDYFVPRFATQ